VRSVRWQRTCKRPRSLHGGPGVRWSLAGGGGSSLRLAWSGRAARGWIGPGWSAAREATGESERRTPGDRRGLIQSLIGGDV
jgi:hypothetical protein